jgi:hypothetical protein
MILRPCSRSVWSKGLGKNKSSTENKLHKSSFDGNIMVIKNRASKTRFILLGASAILTLGSIPSSAAVPAAPKGERAVLTVHFSVHGEGDKPFSQYKGQGTKWATSRSFQASVELEAQKPTQQGLASAATPGPDDPTMAMARAGEELQKQMEECPENDMNCQMALAMKLANSPQMAALNKVTADQSKQPKRYQIWESIKTSKPEIKSTYEEHWETIFYTAAKEVTICKLVGPAITPELQKDTSLNWEQQNREQLEVSGRALRVEVDTETGGNWLLLPAVGMFADKKCSLDIAGGVDHTRESANVTIFPETWLQSIKWLEGTTPSANGVIASGHKQLSVEHDLGNIGQLANGGASIKFPVEVSVDWELRKK